MFALFFANHHLSIIYCIFICKYIIQYFNLFYRVLTPRRCEIYCALVRCLSHFRGGDGQLGECYQASGGALAELPA